MAQAEAAYDTAQRLFQANPGDAQFGLSQAGALLNRGEVLQKSARDDEADRCFGEALALLDREVEILRSRASTEVPGGPPKPAPRIEFTGRPRNLAIILGTWSGRGNLRKPVVFYQRMTGERPGVVRYEHRLARSLYYLGILTLATGSPAEEAVDAVRRADVLYAKLVREHAGNLDYALERGEMCSHLAGVLVIKNQYQDALPWFDWAIPALTAVLDRDPRNPKLRRLLTESHAARGGALVLLDRPVEAISDVKRAIVLDEAKHAALTQLYPSTVASARQRLYRLARQGKHQEAVAEASALAQVPDLPGEALYDAACVHSIAAKAEKGGIAREEHYARAVALLRRAFAAGFAKDPIQAQSGLGPNPLEHMRKDQDLEPLRQREDYQKLLADLAQAPATEGER